MKFTFLTTLLIITLSGCGSWSVHSVPEYAIQTCLQLYGTPTFTTDMWGNTQFSCTPNDDRNSMNARYFNDRSLLESNKK